MRGYRGYIASRPIRGQETPQHVQNLVIRDYAKRNQLFLKLSATEYSMDGCYMMLEGVRKELDNLDGIILFSLFMLPIDPTRRHALYESALGGSATIHAALENTRLARQTDVERWEDMYRIDRALSVRSGGGQQH